MRLRLLLALSLSAAVAAACSSSGDASPSGADQATQPTEGSNEQNGTKDGGPDRAGDGSVTPVGDGAVADAMTDATTDATTDANDATAPPVDAGPPAFTKAEVQALFNANCNGCHIGNASGGMSLANDFTVNTVDVASTQVPTLKRIAKGDRDKSYLLHKLRGTHLTVGGSGARMPRNAAPLSDSDIERLARYVDAL